MKNQNELATDKCRSAQIRNATFRSSHLRIHPWPLLLLLLVACVPVALAQSGRRSTRSPTTAPSVSGPKTVEKSAPKPPPLQLLVAVEDHNPVSNMPYYLSDTVLDNCVRHLNDAAEVNATAAQRGMTRGDAISRAKAADQNLFVVWVQIESDTVSSTRQSKNGPDELYVRYTIFEPGTAKIKQWGRTHQSIYKTGRGGISGGSAKDSPLYSEYALKQAAKEAAERILEAFDITLHDMRVPN
jgi:hypothetical protein